MAEVVEAPTGLGQRVGLTLTAAQVADITRYHQPGRQLAELHRRGFHRATIDRHGQVLLEWAHYDAVCGGAAEKPRWKVKPPVVGKRKG